MNLLRVLIGQLDFYMNLLRVLIGQLGFPELIAGYNRRLQPPATTAARLAQLRERRSAEREVASSNPGRTNTQGLKNN